MRTRWGARVEVVVEVEGVRVEVEGAEETALEEEVEEVLVDVVKEEEEAIREVGGGGTREV